jgi:hypothetical protein
VIHSSACCLLALPRAGRVNERRSREKKTLVVGRRICPIPPGDLAGRPAQRRLPTNRCVGLMGALRRAQVAWQSSRGTTGRPRSTAPRHAIEGSPARPTCRRRRRCATSNRWDHADTTTRIRTSPSGAPRVVAPQRGPPPAWPAAAHALAGGAALGRRSPRRAATTSTSGSRRRGRRSRRAVRSRALPRRDGPSGTRQRGARPGRGWARPRGAAPRACGRGSDRPAPR